MAGKTLGELARELQSARQRCEYLAMTNVPGDEVERMRLSIAYRKAHADFVSAESALRTAIEGGEG